MCDYPFFIPQVVLFANSSLFWFKVTNEHREFRNYLWRYKISEAYSGRTIGYETQFLEDFDSRRWDAGWNLADFDDSRWEPMEAAEWADYKLIKQPTEMLTVYRREPEVIKKEEGCIMYP